MNRSFDYPGQAVLSGRYCILEPVDWARHGPALGRHLSGPGREDIWTYMTNGPFDNCERYRASAQDIAAKNGWQTLAITRLSDGDVVGTASYMRIRQAHGSAEIGGVTFSHALQRTREATEALFLMADHVLGDLGYRRLEWKCNAQNAKSMRAAERLGYSFEGVFRQDMIVKGQNRDTAWFSILDREWPALKDGYQSWLDPRNFDETGEQKRRLEEHFGKHMRSQ